MIRPSVAAAALCAASIAAASPTRDTGYWASSRCRGCHSRIAGQHEASHHERSFTNPVFQSQYFEELLPSTRRDPALADEARRCIACHAPVMHLTRGDEATRGELLDPSMSGVTCDVCHTIRGIDGDAPGNGNYVSSPTPVKRGPYPAPESWHRAYSELHTKSDLCATCHEATNHAGVAVKTTWSEWKGSEFAARGVHCQDCHMTVDGFLVGGESRHESGATAVSNIDAPQRDKLYTHRFSGAHSSSQIEGALAVAISGLPAAVAPGEELRFDVVVDNERTGHKMPTGSSDLRLLWLEVTLVADGQRVQAVPAFGKGYGIAGEGAEDARILGDDVPKGSRIYRSVLLDAAGRQTLSSWTAKRAAFDNRLEPGRKRDEDFIVRVPAKLAGPARLEARLLYRSYPRAFTKWMNVEDAPVVEVARGSAALHVAPKR